VWNDLAVRPSRAAAALLGMAWVLLGAAALAADQEGCLLCHRLGLRIASEGGGRTADVRDAPGGSHGDLYCSDCHPDARNNIPHATLPGPSRCIGECHGSSAAATASHGRASFGGLTETHRNAASPRPPCLACHAYGDGKGDVAAIDARCVACHRKEAAAVREGPHRRMDGSAGRCVGCHPAHPVGASGKTPANCSGPACHARSTARMRAIADHRAPESGAVPWAKGALFLAIAAASRGLAAKTRPGGGAGKGPE